MVRSAVKITQRFTTSQQWSALIALAILVTGLSFAYLVTGQLRQQLIGQQQNLATNLVRNASVLLRTSLSKDDRISANVILQDWVDQELLLSATLYNATQQPIAEQGLQQLSGYHVFWLNHHVTDHNQLIGHLRVAVNMSKAYEISQHNGILLILSTLMISLIAGGLAYTWGERALLSRKQQLTAIEELSVDTEPNLIKQNAYSRDDHFLNTSINKLVQNKQDEADIQQALKHFSNEIMPPKGATLRHHNNSLLFIEVSGFDKLKKDITAKELTHFLNQYHLLLSKAAKLYNGTIDLYSDHGIMMIFGYPENDPKDAIHCIYAAKLFLGLVEKLRGKDALLQSLSFKLAAHWGPILLAPDIIKPTNNTSSELSSDDTVTMAGDTVHWTAYLAHSSNDNKLLVSQDLLDHINSAEEIQWKIGPQVLDLNAGKQKTHWLNALPATAKKLISRQVQQIFSLSNFAD